LFRGGRGTQAIFADRLVCLVAKVNFVIMKNSPSKAPEKGRRVFISRDNGRNASGANTGCIVKRKEKIMVMIMVSAYDSIY
jgi:hypothetical protein